MNKVRNVIFDMDGTLVDTEVLYLDRLACMIRYMGDTLPERELLRLAGKNLPQKLTFLRERFGWKQSPEELEVIYRTLQEGWPQPDFSGRLFPGTLKTLNYLKAHRVGCYIASNSALPHVRRVLGDCGILEHFDGIMTRDIAGERKPDPKIYRLLLEQTPLDASETLAVEDSDTGVEAAVRAGLPVVAIRDPRFDFVLSGAAVEISCIEQLTDYLEENHLV